ncbi:MAG: aminotransferase class I/II-fold pyridoxal phosphate-dependent enzyme, partial [Pseudomonadota bacterium]
ARAPCAIRAGRLRLGFAIGAPETLAGGRGLRELLGPWAVSGPALAVGARALRDQGWATATRDRLARDAARLDTVLQRASARIVGGTSLFRLYEVKDAEAWQDRLAQRRILVRTFPYSRHWVRLGLPGSDDHWARIEGAVA